MTVQEIPYWLSEPSGKVMERILKISALAQETVRTVRRITYLMYPQLHGKALERAYNTTVKDVVRGRILGLIPWDSIRESRVNLRSPDGSKTMEDYVDSLEDPDVSRWYRRSRRPAHIVPLEVWFEKDTVEPEFAEICRRYDIPFLSTRGQLTWTAKRATDNTDRGSLVLYFGDNDPKGREIMDVINRDLQYLRIPMSLKWVAVTEEHEDRFNLPPEARLDGLELEDLQAVIEEEILRYIDQEILERIEEEEERERVMLRRGRLRFEWGEET